MEQKEGGRFRLVINSPGLCQPHVRSDILRRWTDHVTGLVNAQVEFMAWLESLPEDLQDSATAEALRAICDWISANFRRSFRHAASARTDPAPLTLTHVMHRDLPRPSLRATPGALRYGRGSLLCMTVPVQIGSTDMRVPDAAYRLQARSTAFQTAGAARP